MNTSFNLWVNTKPRAKDGTFDIYIRVTQDRRHKSLKTGIAINSISEFNPKAKPGNWIRGRAGAVKKLNDELEKQLEAIKGHYRKLQGKRQAPSKESIVQSYKGNKSADYLAYLKKVISRFQAAGSYRSVKRYNQLLNKLTEFVGKGKPLPFDQINVSFLKDFHAELSGLHKNTIYEHFKNFKASFNQAIAEDLISIDDSPFVKFKVKQVVTHKQKLTLEEIQRLKALKLEPGTAIWNALNCFLFSFYCGGVRAGDVITMRWNNISNGNLSYVMAKTKDDDLLEKSVPLIPEALEILKHYRVNQPRTTDFIFGLLDNKLSTIIDYDKKIRSGHEKMIFDKIASRNAMLNKHLKVLALMAEIDKPLTFHISRHSFAQFAINQEINPKTLQTILGHKKFATTEKYIKTMNSKAVDDAMHEIFKNG
jgi:integrase/recombinase XerD